MPSRATSSSCDPISSTAPSPRTAILSALRTVERRCATSTTVADRFAINASSDAWTLDSLSASSALVASSKRSTRGFRRNARAMEIRCFCPPEMRTPRSPTRVSYPSAKSATNSSASAATAAARISAADAASEPYATLPPAR
mmetsp:Transcript_28953/g.89490  ORF Transcript_28953/g.89490 Transcript_28953/m.89490 type:complete len:142 (+) Transcript_28953:332-757(+)